MKNMKTKFLEKAVNVAIFIAMFTVIFTVGFLRSRKFGIMCCIFGAAALLGIIREWTKVAKTNEKLEHAIKIADSKKKKAA